MCVIRHPNCFMVNIFPNHSEILVSSFSCEEVARKIAAVTQRVNYMDLRDYAVNSPQFNGQVGQNCFQLSLVIKRANTFLPLIRGKMEPTKSGCILFLNYFLFPSAVMLLAFWSLITLLMTLFFIFYDRQWAYALACLAACLGNFGFSWVYFKSKLKESQIIFHQMLSLQEKE